MKKMIVFAMVMLMTVPALTACTGVMSAPVATEPPVQVTEAPVEATEVPVEATEVPVEATEVPEMTEAPVTENDASAAPAA